MKNKLTPLIIIILILVGGGLYYLVTNQGNQSSQSSSATQTAPTTLRDNKEVGDSADSLPTPDSPAEVIEYTVESYNQVLETDKLVVFYFYANWCPVCRTEFPKMRSVLSQFPEEEVIGIRVNYNDSETNKGEEEIAREFNVPYQHTKVFVKNGKVILKSTEGWDEDRYVEEISSAIN